MILEPNSSVPLYEQLKNAIKSDIDMGIFKAGAKMPTESDLEAKYNVSRITVRRAITELCDEDILVKKQGKGTFVLQNITPIPLAYNIGFHEVFESRGMKVRSEILEKKVCKPKKKGIAEDLKIKPDDYVLYIKRVLYAEDDPKMIDQIYLPIKLYPGINERIDQDFSLFRLLKADYEVEASQFYKVMKVRNANAESSAILKVEENTALFDIYKISYMANGMPIHISISYVSGEDASYVVSGSVNSRESYSGINWKVLK